MVLWLNRLMAILAIGTKAFFGITTVDNGATVGKKVTIAAALRSAYAYIDYLLWIASAAFIVIVDKITGFGWFGLFMMMWAFDIAVSCALVAFWKNTSVDITLASSFRRAVDAIHTAAPAAGMIAFIFTMVKAAVWDGPEAVVVFFEKELKTNVRMLLALLALTAVQAAIWTPIYVLGFDTIAELIQHVAK